MDCANGLHLSSRWVGGLCAGGQRYAAHWTGDNVSSWEHYRMNFPMVINMALSGYAIAGATRRQSPSWFGCAAAVLPARLRAGTTLSMIQQRPNHREHICCQGVIAVHDCDSCMHAPSAPCVHHLRLLSAGANIGGFASGPAQAPPGLPSGTCPPDLLSRWITGASFLPWCAVTSNPFISSHSHPDNLRQGSRVCMMATAAYLTQHWQGYSQS